MPSTARPKTHVAAGAISAAENEGPSRAPEDPHPGSDISWGAINNCPPLPVIFPELCGEGDCEALCWNLAARRLGEQPHAGSYSAGQFSSSFGSFTQPCTQWLHKADYKLQRIPEGAKSDAGANEPREPLIPVTEWDKLGKAWTTQIQGSPGSREPALGTGGHYPCYSAGPGTPRPGRPAGRKYHRQCAPAAVGTPLGSASHRDLGRCVCSHRQQSVKSILFIKAGVRAKGDPGEPRWQRCAVPRQRGNFGCRGHTDLSLSQAPPSHPHKLCPQLSWSFFPLCQSHEERPPQSAVGGTVASGSPGGPVHPAGQWRTRSHLCLGLHRSHLSGNLRLD